MTVDNGAGMGKTLSLRDIELRLRRIEEHLSLGVQSGHVQSIGSEKNEDAEAKAEGGSKGDLEYRIGGDWSARTGLVLTGLGLIFLLVFPFETVPDIISVSAGFAAAATLFLYLWTRRDRKTSLFSFLSGGGMLLLYFCTLRLHFFGRSALVENMAVESLLLGTVACLFFLMAVGDRSAVKAFLASILLYITAGMTQNSLSVFLLLTLLSALSSYAAWRLSWYRLLILNIWAVYLLHLLWFINNPIAGGPLELRSDMPSNLIFILLYSCIFSMGLLFRDLSISEEGIPSVSSLFSSAGAYFCFLLVSLAGYPSLIPSYHIAAAVLFLGLAWVYWKREKSRYSTFFNAILAYSALSAAIVSSGQMPWSFLWLCWQSLLVIVTAVYFRSKIIVLANFFIFLMIFSLSLLLAGAEPLIGLSFGVVALLSARIMNAKRENLALRTEAMRNAYLITAFLILPYSLYNLVPGQYIIFVWILLSGAYYFLSRILNNIKYRYLALGTLLLTALYVFVIGITYLEPVYRILSFLALGAVLLTVSRFYSGQSESGRKKNDSISGAGADE